MSVFVFSKTGLMHQKYDLQTIGEMLRCKLATHYHLGTSDHPGNILVVLFGHHGNIQGALLVHLAISRAFQKHLVDVLEPL